MNTFHPYTSQEVLGRLILPEGTVHLSDEDTSRLNTFFQDYIEPHLLPAEHKMVIDGDYKWLALVNPIGLEKGMKIELRQITVPETPSHSVTCVIGDNFIPRNEWGLYLFRIVG